MTDPFLSVALCTHNHVKRLARTLDDLRGLQQPRQPWELIVVDNGCTDRTPRLLSDSHWHPPGAHVRVVREEKLGLSHARNRAVQEARGEYLLFLDDDETPDTRWLAAHQAAMEEFHPDASGGRIEVLFEGPRPAWLADELLAFLGKLDYGEATWLTDRSTPFYGGNFAIRRGLTARVGLFDTALGRQGSANNGGEDTEFYRHLLATDCKIRWVSEAVIHHRIEASKLKRGYFLDLHYRQGRMKGARKRGAQSRIPPRYLIPQIACAFTRALDRRFRKGANHSLRLEMNAAYLTGYVLGWMFDPA